MRKQLFFAIFCCLQGIIFAQSAWRIEDYSKWDHSNFRQNPSFNRPFSTSNPDYLLLDAIIFFMTNEERSKVGVAPMSYHKMLEIAAYNHSLKMATTGFFSHQNSVDASRYSTSDRGKLAGVSNPSFAENIAYNYPAEGSSYLQVGNKLIVQWMNSPGHKENILSSKGRQLGVGTYYYDDKIYGTQVFQWFSYVKENPYGSVDQLPIMTTSNSTQNTISANSNYTTSTCSPTNNSTSNTKNQYEITELKNQVLQYNQRNSEQEKTINQLKRELTEQNNKITQLNLDNSNLKFSNSQLQQQKNEKDLQYNKLYSEHQTLTDRRTTVKKSKYNADEFHAITIKFGMNTFYQSINNGEIQPFDANFLSFGAETMLGFNFGDTYKRNSIGLTIRANQANRYLTNFLDSSSIQPLQFYDAELTTIIREWLTFGVGANINTSYASAQYQVNPSMSLGFCFGPKNWKIQITQQATLKENSKVYGRLSMGLALKI
jgi:uncharacterized protein YkwD